MATAHDAKRIRPASGRVAAITGACTYLGTELVRRLEEDPRYARILVLDVRPPPVRGDKISFYNVDLTQPTVDDELATLLVQIGRASCRERV